MNASGAAPVPVILVADDSLDIRDALSALLEDEGYNPVEAADGQDALALALERNVDLILLDLSMPRLTGTAFCQAYHDRGGTAPIVLVTGFYSNDVVATIEACGAVGYLPKPFEIDQVLKLIERNVGRPPEAAS